MKILHVVHCIDTEGPLTEDINATFERLNTIFGVELEPTKDNLLKIQKNELNLENGKQISKVFSKELLTYNNNWQDIDTMLSDCMSNEFRNKLKDDFDGGWVYSWHCMDHAGYSDNPRRKDIGYGNVFRFYRQKLKEMKIIGDEINWHFHPLSFTRNPLQAATSYNNNMDVLLNVLCRRIIEDSWFPVCNRPGFHSERPDSHLFLEQWIPFDYANQRYDYDDGQADLAGGRFGDWRKAPREWNGYHPSHDNYQEKGHCRRVIFRCLNIGTRFNLLKKSHVIEAFNDAERYGRAILAFADHDYRALAPDVEYLQNLISQVKVEYPDIKIKFSGAVEAARDTLFLGNIDSFVKLKAELHGNKLIVNVISGRMFGPQPFLAIKSKTSSYHHDNFDVIEFGVSYSYTFDSQTIALSSVDKIGVASADKFGHYDVNIIEV
jgi:hypothetical protein